MGRRLAGITAMVMGCLRLTRLPILSLLAITAAGCGSPPSLNMLAYDECMARHPHESAVCEAPRQAYDLDPTAHQPNPLAITQLPSGTSLH